MPTLSPRSRNLLRTIVVALVSLYLAIALLGIVRRNYELQQQINKLVDKNNQLEQSNQDLRYQITYYGTDSFKDKAARAKLGLQAPGESVIILPKETPTKLAPTAKAKPPKSNFWQWIDFLRGVEQ